MFARSYSYKVTIVLTIRSDEQFSKFSDGYGTRMEGGSCVAALEESPTWTVLQQRSYLYSVW